MHPKMDLAFECPWEKQTYGSTLYVESRIKAYINGEKSKIDIYALGLKSIWLCKCGKVGQYELVFYINI